MGQNQSNSYYLLIDPKLCKPREDNTPGAQLLQVDTGTTEKWKSNVFPLRSN